MSHKFRFSKESRERLKNFLLGDWYKPKGDAPAQETENPQPQAEAVSAARGRTPRRRPPARALLW